MLKVGIVQRIVPHYRVRLFDLLHSSLQNQGISLTVYAGLHPPGGTPQGLLPDRPWFRRLDNCYIPTGMGSHLVAQPLIPEISSCKLLIVEHAARMISSYFYRMSSFLGGTKFAFWGHGRNFQSDASGGSVAAHLRYGLLRMADWWFAYTDLSRRILIESGYPSERITVLNNTIERPVLDGPDIDIDRDRALIEGLKAAGKKIAIYCGGMYKEKHLDFLIDCCERVGGELPDFHILFVGDGPDADRVRRYCASSRFATYFGPRYGSELKALFKVSQALLMPGVVGLAIVDAFHNACPLLTTDIAGHGPEIAYLEPEANGLMTAFDREAYSKGIIRLLTDLRLHSVMKQACERWSEKLTLESMSTRFAEGIVSCLLGKRSVGRCDAS